ncbi:MAG TPA: hypothetical protein VEZ48_11920 [Sphingomonadaceae bacterium]|nr:hypothetical protein [Sphingomonadaceae bacterium]
MTRFYFNLHECGHCTLDEEGVLLVNEGAARAQALAEARAIMSAEVAEGRLCLSCHIEVLGADGRSVVTVPFIEALAVSGL